MPADVQNESCRRSAGSRCRAEAVTVRQPGSRYPTVAEAERAREKRYSEMTGRKIFLRFLVSFIVVTVLAFAVLTFSIAFLPSAKAFHDKHTTSVPLVLCVIGLVLGVVMLLGGMLLGYHMMSHRMWRHLASREVLIVHHTAQTSPNQEDLYEPPDPNGAPPLYTVCAAQDFEPPTTDSTNQWLPVHFQHHPPEVLLVLPSYSEALSQKFSELPPPDYAASVCCSQPESNQLDCNSCPTEGPELMLSENCTATNCSNNIFELLPNQHLSQ